MLQYEKGGYIIIYRNTHNNIHIYIYTYTYTRQHTGGYMMNTLTTKQQTALAQTQNIQGLYNSFISYLDASPKTVETYSRAIRQFMNFLNGRGITAPTREDVLAYRDELRATRKPATVQNYITATRLFFQWTETAGLYPNVANHVKGAKLNKEHKKDYLTAGQVKEVLGGINRDTAQGRRNYAIVALMVTGGLRDIEINRANIEDLRTLGADTVLYVQGKGRTERTDYVKVAPEVERAIRESLKDRQGITGKSPLFASLSNNSKGERMTTRAISGTVKTALQRAGFDSERLTAHSLRHTAVTLALLGGNTLQEAQQFARHSNIATTLIYSHNLERANNNCEATIAGAIF